MDKTRIAAFFVAVLVFHAPSRAALGATPNEKPDAKNANKNPSGEVQPVTQGLKRRPDRGTTLEPEQVDQFVARHLPELVPVLEQLRFGHAKYHARAIRDLSRSIERIENARRRDKQLYDVEVAVLRTRVGANLAAARLKVRDSTENRTRLQKAVSELTTAENDRAKYDVETLTRRRETVERLLRNARARLEATQEHLDAPELLFESYLRKASRSPPAAEPKS